VDRLGTAPAAGTPATAHISGNTAARQRLGAGLPHTREAPPAPYRAWTTRAPVTVKSLIMSKTGRKHSARRFGEASHRVGGAGHHARDERDGHRRGSIGHDGGHGGTAEVPSTQSHGATFLAGPAEPAPFV
jgi:hypothetical protein